MKGGVFSNAFREIAEQLGLEVVKSEGNQVNILGLDASGYESKHIGLKINGVVYSALQITHSDNKGWVLQATGNGEPIEYSAVFFAKTYKNMGLNVLLVNGPGVGRSGGRATPSSTLNQKF